MGDDSLHAYGTATNPIQTTGHMGYVTHAQQPMLRQHGKRADRLSKLADNITRVWGFQASVPHHMGMRMCIRDVNPRTISATNKTHTPRGMNDKQMRKPTKRLAEANTGGYVASYVYC